jgi:hypothetical protein
MPGLGMAFGCWNAVLIALGRDVAAQRLYGNAVIFDGDNLHARRHIYKRI